MSDLYNSLYKFLDPKRYDKRDKQGNSLPMDMLKCEMGTSFEELLEAAIRKRLFGAERPGEFRTTEGVIYTPDHFIFNGVFRLGEFKLTWYSNVGLTDPRFDKWLCQIKCYCYHLETPYARLYVLYVNNDYKPPTPVLQPYDLEFTQKELVENWNMVKRHGVSKGLL